MLARKYRLRKNSDFQRLYKYGKRFVSHDLVFYFAPSRMDYPQFGFVVSKKVSKSAVVRNTLRRRVSAIVEENFQLFSTPIKAVVLIKKDFSPIKPQDLQKQLLELLKKAAQ